MKSLETLDSPQRDSKSETQAIDAPNTTRKKKRKMLGYGWRFYLPVFILLVFTFVAIFANFLAPHNPVKNHLEDSLTPPIWQDGGKAEYPLGTDQLGRDILSRLIYGARTSLIVALLGVFLTGIIGTILGVLAGYKGGWVDAIISRAIDVIQGFPLFLVALVLAIVIGGSLLNIIIIITIMFWVGYARQARAEALQIRESAYCELARIAGCSDFTIMVRHVIPNVMNSVIVIATLGVGSVILLESGLSFLGAGIPPPTPSWGSMCSDGRSVLTTAWWVSFWPGVAIMAVVLSGNLLGDWLRDKLDPKLRDL
jgi:peptide/nickel transport system permease protein